MRVGRFEIKRRVAVAAASVVIGVVGWRFWSMRNPVPGPAAGATTTPALSVAGPSAGDLLREQAEFFDPAPLFLPSPQNFGQGRTATALKRQPDEVFRNFEPEFRFPDQKLATYGLESEPPPQRAVDTLGRGDIAPFAGMGEVDRPLPPMGRRAAFVEIKALMTGNIIHAAGLADIPLPRADFSPVECLVVVSPAGVVGDPLVTTSSGSEELDNFVRDYLVKSYRIGDRIGPGNYSVCLGP